MVAADREERPAPEQGRGREATRPQDIPRPGWWDILSRTKSEIDRDHVPMTAAAVAFYGLLALFPAIAALISIWGWMLEPDQIRQQIEQVSAILPEQAAGIVTEQARKVASNAGTGTGLAAIGGLLFTLYSASAGVRALIEGLNIIYGEEDRRGFIKRNLLALALSLALIAMMIAALALILLLPAVVSQLGLGGILEGVIALLRWPLLAVATILGLAVLYRFAPDRRRARWRWVTWGSVFATAVWLAGSILFSVYVSNFGSYNETYGSMGAVIVLLLWFWLSSFVVLVGAELNAEIERQTRHDTTIGETRPLGERGAYVADTVGERS